MSARRRPAAFTLVEVLAAMAFLAILVPVLVAALSVASRASVAAERGATALQLGENKLNELLLDSSWSSGNNRGDFSPDWPAYRWELTSADWPDASELSELTMRVYYQVQGQEREADLSTLATTQ